MREKIEDTIVLCNAKQAFGVFNQVFKTGEVDRFINKHEKNPDRLQGCIFCKQEDNEIAGINAFMGCKMLICQKSIRGAQSCDTAVLESFRKRGIFTRIVLGAEEYLEKEGVEILFGIPNDKSFHGFLGMGWRVGSEIGTVFLRLSPFKARNIFKYWGSIVDTVIGYNFFQLEKKRFMTAELKKALI